MSVKICAAYVRVSTTDQEEYSPDSQIKAIRDYAKREGYILPDEYIFRDDGISGKSADKRPAFRMMIATAKEENCQFNTIFVWKYSRFARNQEEAIVYKNLLRKKGIDVRSITEPSNDSPFSSLIERIIEWMDEYYLINLSGEVKRGMAEKAVRCEAMGRPPLGYSVKDKVFVPDENADIIRTIFEWYASGISQKAICYKLAESGVRSRGGKIIVLATLQHILNNPVYIGKFRWNSSDVNVDDLPDGKHEPIISRELWDQAQERHKKRDPSVKYERVGHPVHMFKGLLRCGNCGCTLAVRYAQKNHYSTSLQCSGYASGKCKVSHFILVSRAEETIIRALEEIVANRTFTFAPHKPSKTTLTQDWDKLIAAEETRLKRARTAYLDGVFSEDEFVAAKKEIDSNIAKLKASKAQAEEQEPDIDIYCERTMQVLDIIKSESVSGEAKNIALRSIIEKIVYNKAENTFDFYFYP